MVPRIAAVVLGAVAGIAAVLILALDWNSAVALLGIDRPAILAVLSDPLPRWAWIASVAVSAFAAVSLLIALVAGFAEVLVARARIDALRHDPALVGRWNPSDWRAAFAHTAVHERTEAIVAALLPVAGSRQEATERRVIADAALLVDLDKIWLERLALDGVIGPLPNLLLGVGATLALLRYASGEPGWEIALAAGAAGWLLIKAVHYFVRLVLSPLVALAVGAATAAVRPLTSALSLELIARRASDERPPMAGPTFVLEPRAPEATMLVSGPGDPQLLARMSEAADRLDRAGATLVGQLAGQLAELASQAGQAGAAAAAAPLAAIATEIRGAVQQREQAIESVLAEVRAGIEELLAAPPPGRAPQDMAESVRRALADQGETLRQAGAELRGGVEAVAGSLQAALGSIEATERRSADMLAELLRVVESVAAPAGPLARHDSVAPEDGKSNAEIADALRNLLREFDEG